MANRVLLGARAGGTIGFYVSRPGQNVLTATGNNLLISTEQKMFQILESGSFFRDLGIETISWGPFGYRPRILITSQYNTNLTYINDNSAQIDVDDSNTWYLADWGIPISNRTDWYALRPY